MLGSVDEATLLPLFTTSARTGIVATHFSDRLIRDMGHGILTCSVLVVVLVLINGAEDVAENKRVEIIPKTLEKVTAFLFELDKRISLAVGAKTD